MGNYACSLLVGARANQKGYDQVLWLDSNEHKYVEEVGSMNMFFVIDGVVKTPALVGLNPARHNPRQRYRGLQERRHTR